MTHPAKHSVIFSKKTLAALIGTALEFYDFLIFSLLIPVLAPLFFPSSNALISTLYAFGLFFVSYLMRPIGGLIFGYIGDRFGRSRALMISINTMALSTLFMGLLPTYGQIGVLAPVLFIILRLIQGASIGGEYIGAALVVVEHAPEKKQGFYGSIVTSSIIAGVLLANFSCFSLKVLPHAHAWRAAFILGGIIGFVGLFLRKRFISDTPSKSAPFSLQFIADALKKDFYNFILCLIYTGIAGAHFYFLFVYIPAHLTILKGWLPASTLLHNTMMMVLYGVFALVGGYLSDRFSPKKVILAASMVCGVLSVTFFYYLEKGGMYTLGYSAILVYGASLGMYHGPANQFMAQLFSKQHRYTNIALSYGLGMALVGGTTPFMLGYLGLHGVQFQPWYVLMLTALSAVVVLKLRPRYSI